MIRAPTRCWWCQGRLVGKGGVAGREPLFYRVVFISLVQDVRVHKCCEKDTKQFVQKVRF